MIEVYENGKRVHQTKDFYGLLAWTKGVVHAMNQPVTSLLPKQEKTGGRIQPGRRMIG